MEFALWYACWLLDYPLGATAGPPAAVRALAVIAAAGAVAELRPGRLAIRGTSSTAIPTCRDHPHWPGRAGEPNPGRHYAHAFVLDDFHLMRPYTAERRSIGLHCHG